MAVNKVIAGLAFGFLLALGQPLYTQTVIGGIVPDTSAMLDIRSTDRGVLFPRLTTLQRDAIPNPAEGLMVYNVTTKCLEINLGTPYLPAWTSIKCPPPPGSVSTLDCAQSTISGSLYAGTPAAGLVVRVPYTGGDGGYYGSQSVASTGVTGLTAMLSAGYFATGSDTLAYLISGTPDTVGTAALALSVGGQACPVSLPVAGCGAYVAAGQWKQFQCHNLAAANTAADPRTPSWEIIGGYWQWGQAGPDPASWRTTNTAHFAHGPTGPSAGEANAAPIVGWDPVPTTNGAWADAAKTTADPCPAGYRVPTRAQWDSLLLHNTHTDVGTWLDYVNNYTSGRFFGPDLMLPAAGNRDNVTGLQFTRGFSGHYWSTTASGDYQAWILYMGFFSGTYTTGAGREYGLSVRCISE